MKLSYNWLQDHVRTDLTAEEIAERLTMSGTEVERVEESGRDKVMSLEITSNRPDCLSVLGLAREVAAVSGRKLKIPQASVTVETDVSFPCVLEASDLCALYTARVIKDVKVGAAEDAMKARLEAMGLRCVNNIVDITNYCLMELGHPLHAFDMDKLEGGKIVIRRARKGEKIVTIDEKTHELDENVLIIADAEKPVAIAGIMGGKGTEVTESTRNVVLESAYFDPACIRRTSRRLGVQSDSSYRFERGVDKEGVVSSSDRATEMIRKVAGARPGQMTKVGALQPETVVLRVNYASIRRLSGIDIPRKTVNAVLESLGMEISGSSEGGISVKVPSFREDIRRDADIVEEVMRIYGYDKVPSLIRKMVPSPVRRSRSRQVVGKVRELLPGMGLSEIMTYSLISEQAAHILGREEKAVKLKNPLSEEQDHLTPHLADGMLGAFRYNLNRQNTDLGFFEVGKRYLRAKDGYTEDLLLALGLTGRLGRDWHDGERMAGFYHLKGIVEELMERLGLRVVFKPSQKEAFTGVCAIEHEEAGFLGFIGEAGKELRGHYGLDQEVLYSELELHKLTALAQLARRYEQLSRFPGSTRDVSVLADESTPGGELLGCIEHVAASMMRKASLVDIYRGEQVPRGKKSLTFSIEYGLPERTLTDSEVDPLHEEVRKALKERFGVSFR